MASSDQILKINEIHLSPTFRSNDASKRKDYIPWEDYFMAVAFLSSMRSKDPCTQVGACIVNSENKIVAIGYNGMPKGCSDEDLPWGKSSEKKIETKYMYVCHAEMNAIMNKNSADVANCKIYVALFPCNECAKVVIQSRIKEIIYYSDKHKDKQETIASKILLDMAGVPYRQANLSSQSINLDFKSICKEKERALGLQDANHMNCDYFSQNLPRDINEKRNDFISWEEYFMSLAFLSAERSKDPSMQMGACIVNPDYRIVGIGYNGMPIGCSDDLLPWNKEADSKLQTKYLYVCHAEMNAILNKNCGVINECCLYVTLFPCNECAKCIIQAGIQEVVYYSDKYHMTPAVIASKKMFDLAKIKYREYNGVRHKLTINFDAIN